MKRLKCLSWVVVSMLDGFSGCLGFKMSYTPLGLLLASIVYRDR